MHEELQSFTIEMSNFGLSYEIMQH